MATVSKADYLKKYLSGDSSEPEKKRRRKKRAKVQNTLIVDDDVNWKNLVTKGAGEDGEQIEEEKPIIIDFKDLNTDDVAHDSDLWKPLETNLAKRRRHHSQDDISSERNSVNSPVRKGRQRHDSDDDLSPVRRGRQRHDSDDLSPVRKGRQRHDSDGALSPVRRGRQRHYSDDLSPVRKRQQRHDSDDDLSPVRRGRQRHDSDGDLSPVRKGRQRHNSDGDLSPVRKGRQRHDSDGDLSPVRKGRQRHDSDGDLSPVRKGRQRHDSDGDLSPVRKGHHEPSATQRHSKHTSGHSREGQDVHRRRHKHGSHEDTPSTRRRRHDSDLDDSRSGDHIKTHSEAQVRSNTVLKSAQVQVEGSSEKDSESRKAVMSFGGKSGLLSASELHRETERLKKDQTVMLKSMDPSKSGRHAATVYRDKAGKRINAEEEKAKQKEKDRIQAVEDEKFFEWGRGMTQTREAKDKVEDMAYEMSKPLARYKDDDDLETLLKAREREGDPMLAYLKKKQKQKTVTKKEKPKWNGSFPQNRFDIRPGYRWDGVDRSNGFEKDLFLRDANKKAVQEMAYKWSVEDM